MKRDRHKARPDSMQRLTLLIILAVSSLDAAPRVRLGGVGVNVGYYGGSSWGYPRAFGLYDPYWYSPFVHSGMYNGFGYGPNLGEIKLEGADKEDSIYLDGAYAGPARKLKSMWLEPGAYNLQVRDPAGRKFERRVYVLTGKTLRIRPEVR
ncbi:MAG: hypothetical protein WKF37_14060 [Bryobacteraceae bacterium]